jgi:hypothetical protein
MDCTQLTGQTVQKSEVRENRGQRVSTGSSSLAFIRAAWIDCPQVTGQRAQKSESLHRSESEQQVDLHQPAYPQHGLTDTGLRSENSHRSESEQ